MQSDFLHPREFITYKLNIYLIMGRYSILIPPYQPWIPIENRSVMLVWEQRSVLENRNSFMYRYVLSLLSNVLHRSKPFDITLYVSSVMFTCIRRLEIMKKKSLLNWFSYRSEYKHHWDEQESVYNGDVHRFYFWTKVMVYIHSSIFLYKTKLFSLNRTFGIFLYTMLEHETIYRSYSFWFHCLL